MADYYTSFSCILDVGSAENVAKALALYRDYAAELERDESMDIGFAAQAQANADVAGTAIWIHDDGNGEVEHVIVFARRCGQALDLSGRWGFQYANTCSRPRLDNIIAAGHRVVVGDADGADAAVQAHYRDRGYERLTVFCSESAPRNNLMPLSVQHVAVPRGVTGFAFHAVKDQEIAAVADYGLMAWDGKSPGTILNALRLIRAGRASILFEQPVARSVTIRSVDDWCELVATRDPEIQTAIRQRATP